MTLEIDEPEILDGTHGFAETQRMFAGQVDLRRQRYDVKCGWYDTSINEHEGAFCLVASGGKLEELVGEFVKVSWHGNYVYLYCVGGANLPTPFAVTRRAWMGLADLAIDEIGATVQVIDRA